jgi:xanthine dehydrogenase accessory factor
MKLSLLREALAARGSERPAAIATDLGSGRQALLVEGRWSGELALDAAARARIDELVRADKSATIETEGGKVFVEIHNPPLRCVIVGAVHIAQPLARMAALAGYAVTIVDPRRAFANEERFPGVDLSTDWPDEALEALRPDRRTAIVTLTHDPKIDDPALVTALRSEAFYIGALGSRKTHASRCARLREQGFGDADFARIHGPVGLSIGALSPAEIAVSILAQIIATLRADRMKARGEKEAR